MVDRLIEKIQRLRVLLFIVAPESAMFGQLSEAHKSEYEKVDATGDGLSRVDFHKVLSSIGKSVSVSAQQTVRPAPVERGLFGQARWGRTDAGIRGA